MRLFLENFWIASEGPLQLFRYFATQWMSKNGCRGAQEEVRHIRGTFHTLYLSYFICRIVLLLELMISTN